MDFYTNQSFHIYNQGNLTQSVYLSDDNYKYFLWKMRAYLPLFGDLIAWCLMPNHFHWLFHVQRLEVHSKELWAKVDQVEWQRRRWKYGSKAKPIMDSRPRKQNEGTISLNKAIGLLEQSYSQAVNKETGVRGSLFRPRCKAKDGFIDDFISLEGPNKHLFKPGEGYFYNCFCYIHDNPSQAGLVANNIDWPYSSARDYARLRRGSLCNLALGRELISFL